MKNYREKLKEKNKEKINQYFYVIIQDQALKKTKF